MSKYILFLGGYISSTRYIYRITCYMLSTVMGGAGFTKTLFWHKELLFQHYDKCPDDEL